MENKTEANNSENQPAVVKAETVAAKATEPSTPPKNHKAEKPAGNSKVLLLLALLIAVVAIGGSGYVWQLSAAQQQQLTTLQANTAAAMQRVNQQATQTRELQRQLDRQHDAASADQAVATAKIVELQSLYANQQKKLLSLTTTDRDDWLLAEAEYLMRLANQRLLMGKELVGAQALLKAADDIVRELDDRALFTVREALAQDMAALQTAAKFDLEGVYLQLGALAGQVQQLRLIEQPEISAAIDSQDVTDQSRNWQQQLQTGLQAALEKLSRYIKINRRDDMYKPLLAPEYEAAVRQNIRLMFEQAQLATLAGKQQLYLDSLSKAKQWLNDYYTLDASAAAVIVQALDQLMQQQVEVVMPDISASLRALKNYLEAIHSIKPPVQSYESVEEPAA
jgi:uroporphyrin-3 C-methyltransferase